MIKTKEKLYFAYGSNMNLNQMAFRCPDAEVVESVRLEGYRLAFRTNGGGNGVATILPEEGSYVDGVLWRISERDEQHLDHYEGFPFLYGKEPVTVTDQDGVRREIMAYTMNSPYKDKPAMPSVSYLGGILNGCRQNGIDTQTVFEAVRCTQQELPQKVVPHKNSAIPNTKKNDKLTCPRKLRVFFQPAGAFLFYPKGELHEKHLKRFLSMMMAVLLCFGIVPNNAFAAEYDYDGYISMIDYNGRGYSLSSSLPAPFGGYSTDKFTELRINDLTAFRTAYCIQLGVATHTGIGYDQSDDYAALTTEQKAMINTALTLGYNVETGTKYGGSAMDEYIATQILIWLIAHGQLGTGYENQIVNEITANSPAAKTIFQKLRENVVTYHTVPSFTTDNPSAVGAYTHDLKYNEDTGKNETTLVDENNVLKDFPSVIREWIFHQWEQTSCFYG